MVALTVPQHLFLDFSSNPARPPADVPPRLRRRPLTGALNQKLLLLGAGCLQLRRPGLKAAAHPKHNKNPAFPGGESGGKDCLGYYCFFKVG